MHSLILFISRFTDPLSAQFLAVMAVCFLIFLALYAAEWLRDLLRGDRP